MMIRIDQDSKIPIYLQIYESVVSAIAAGTLEGGVILPSARKLARDLGINYHTANKAYNLLELEGFVRMSSKKTVVVTEINRSQREEFLEKWRMVEIELIKEAKAKGLKGEDLMEMFRKIIEAIFEASER